MSVNTFNDNLVNLANAECFSMMDEGEREAVAEQGSWYTHAVEELGHNAMVGSVEDSPAIEA